MYVKGFGLIIIRKELTLDIRKINEATKSGVIIPIGLSVDLNGPRMIFLIVKIFFWDFVRKFFLNVIICPINNLLIS